METDQLAKMIAERVITNRGKKPGIGWAIENWELCAELEFAIRDLNLVQAEPIPEGAVPVVVYVGVTNVGDKTLVKCEAIDAWQDEDKCQLNAFDDDDTHRVRLEGYALPVSVPTVKAKAVQP